jgi:hypothetical protein
MIRLILPVLMMALLPLPQADAYSRRGTTAPYVAAVVPDGPEGVGCYWERGRMFCSRYCYVEVDGHRFCRHRPHEAHSQAPVYELPPMALTPMK